MYSDSKRAVRINSGVASLKEVQDMKLSRQTSCVLARTLPSRREGFEQMLCQVIKQNIILSSC